MGKTVILVVEKPTELDNIHRVSERVKIKPSLGIRARLSSRGAGRWEQSGGDFSKFGLSAAEMVEAVDKLKAWGEVDTLKLLHFHLGSQISAIKSVKNALREAGRLFCRDATSSARRACRTSTSAAASASTTTARRPTSRRR